MGVISLQEVKSRGRRLTYSTGKSLGATPVNLKDYWTDIVDDYWRYPRVREFGWEAWDGYTRHKQAELKKQQGWIGAGHFDGSHKKKYAHPRDMIFMDVDHGDEHTLDAIHATLGRNAYCVHSTFSHHPDAPRYRIVFPLSEPVEEIAWLAIVYRIMSAINPEYFDETTDQYSRIMYLPNQISDIDYVFKSNPGPFMEVPMLLSTYGEGDEWKNPANWPLLKSAKRQQRRQQHSNKRHPGEASHPVVRIFCELFPPDVALRDDRLLGKLYIHEYADRWTYINASVPGGLHIYHENQTLFSHGETDPISDGRAYWTFDAVQKHLFGDLDENGSRDSREKRASFKAMMTFVHTLPEFSEAYFKEEFPDGKNFDEEDSEPDAEGKPTQGNAFDVYNLLRKSRGLPKKSIYNTNVIIEKDRHFADLFWLNTRNDIVYVKKPYLQNSDSSSFNKPFGRAISDIDLNAIRYYLTKRYQHEDSIQSVNLAIALVAGKNPINPVEWALKECGTWDGTPRVDTVLIDHLGAEDNPVNREICRIMMLGGVARGVSPGCKFDTHVILEGPQGAFKSTFVEMLSLNKGMFYMYIDEQIDKDMKIELSRAWIVQMSEMSTMKRTANDVIKAVLSESVDTLRRAYGTHSQDYKRGSILISTTNETSDYLTDLTGNRRHLPVLCKLGVFSKKKFAANLNQLWAEAYERYGEGENWYLTNKTLEGDLVKEQNKRVVYGLFEEVIDEFLFDLDTPPEAFEETDVPMIDTFQFKDIVARLRENSIYINSNNSKIKERILRSGKWGWTETRKMLRKNEFKKFFYRLGSSSDPDL